MHTPITRAEGTALAEIIRTNYGPCTCDEEAQCKACAFIESLGQGVVRLVEARRHKDYWLEGEGIEPTKGSAPVAEPSVEDVPW